jgi:hypothetical protein
MYPEPHDQYTTTVQSKWSRMIPNDLDNQFPPSITLNVSPAELTT